MGKYEEALERARAGKPIDEVFPELKESDEFVKIVSIVYKFVRKVLDYFGVYSEEEELIDSREEILCYFSQDCAEEIIETLRPDSYKNCNSRWKPSDEHPEGGCSEKPNDLLSEPDADLAKASRNVYESWMGGTMDDVRRDMVELGKVLNARKEE